MGSTSNPAIRGLMSALGLHGMLTRMDVQREASQRAAQRAKRDAAVTEFEARLQALKAGGEEISGDGSYGAEISVPDPDVAAAAADPASVLGAPARMKRVATRAPADERRAVRTPGGARYQMPSAEEEFGRKMALRSAESQLRIEQDIAKELERRRTGLEVQAKRLETDQKRLAERLKNSSALWDKRLQVQKEAAAERAKQARAFEGVKIEGRKQVEAVRQKGLNARAATTGKLAIEREVARQKGMTERRDAAAAKGAGAASNAPPVRDRMRRPDGVDDLERRQKAAEKAKK